MMAKFNSAQKKAAIYMIPGLCLLFIFIAINNFFEVRKLDDLFVIAILTFEFLAFLSLVFGGAMIAFKRHMPRCPCCTKMLYIKDIKTLRDTNVCMHCGECIVSKKS